MRTFILSFIAFALFITITATAFAESYTCPMHPHYIHDEEGSCPICGMDLVAIETSKSEEIISSSAEAEILYWVAPMDPNYRRDKPGKSPMGMDLVPFYAEHENKVGSGIRISAETIQSIGVRTAIAKIINFGENIRSYGIVTDNIRLKQEISSRIAGWVEYLKITAIGDEVKKGDLLFKLYSPELISTQQDYLAALATGSKGRIASSAKRLASLGVQNTFIKELKTSRKKSQNVPFYAETNGIVSELHVSKGSYVKPGMQIASIQDYSVVWVNASVAEKDLQFLSQQNKATVVLPNLGGAEYSASVDYIYPTIDTASRTGQVRLVLDNKNRKLKPGAYADVTFETNIQQRLAIPTEAILKKSDGDYVVIALADNRFESRKIITGIKTNSDTEIISGVRKDEIIVISSQFLIDSESSLKEAFHKFKAPKKASTHE